MELQEGIFGYDDGLQAPLCSFQELVNVENNPMPLSEAGHWTGSTRTMRDLIDNSFFQNGRH